jgi:hypothetical protein
MVFERFGIVCLLSMLFGVVFAILVQESHASREDRTTACPVQFHPACAPRL